MGKITDAKIGGSTREQYQAKVKGKESERALEYITYQSLRTNMESELEKRAHHSKKEAILEYCSIRDTPSCRNARSLKADLDFFQSRRQVLPKSEGIPVY
jgi:cellobiose phosphorylase